MGNGKHGSAFHQAIQALGSFSVSVSTALVAYRESRFDPKDGSQSDGPFATRQVIPRSPTMVS